MNLHNNRGAMGYGIEAFNERNPLAWPSFAAAGRRDRFPSHRDQRERVRPAARRRDQFLPAAAAAGVPARCRQMMGTMHGTEIFSIACPDISRDTARDIAAFSRDT